MAATAEALASTTLFLVRPGLWCRVTRFGLAKLGSARLGVVRFASVRLTRLVLRCDRDFCGWFVV